MRVLIVDDDDRFRLLVRALMPRWATVVGEASDGRMAIDQAVRLTPHVVLIDFQMPVMDGIAAAKEIRTFLPAAHIIVLSGNEAAEAEAAQADLVFVRKDTLDADRLSAVIAA